MLTEMKLIISIYLVIIFTCNSYASSQLPDKLIIDDKEYSLLTNPLEEYFNKNPYKRPKFIPVFSSLNRNYIATFEIIENRLYISKVEFFELNKETNQIISHDLVDCIFSSKRERYLDSYTAILTIGIGNIINYVNMGYESAYSNYKLIEVHKGVITKQQNYTCKELDAFKKKKFKEFRKSEKYRIDKSFLRQHGLSKKQTKRIITKNIINKIKML